jgi:hypothetical protein
VQLFTLLDVDLGALAEVVEAPARAAAELEREQATAAVRLARARNEREVNAELGDALAEPVLRYRQIEVWRELVQRWDGQATSPAAIAAAMGGGATLPPPEATGTETAGEVPPTEPQP